MPIQQVRFVFGPNVSMQEAEGTLRLAQIAAESLFGSDRVELEAPCASDRSARTIIIQAGTEAGRTLALIFLGYVRREFGADAVRVEQPRRALIETAGAA